MRIVWSWLAECVDVSGLRPEAVAEALTAAGLPVEDLHQISPDVAGVVVGLVRTCEPHPRADRLRLCAVDVGEQEPLQLVCGAPNVAAGQLVAVARVGAMLPQGEIREAEIRGVVSQGMICSAAELGLDVRLLTEQRADGILVLRDAVVGADVSELLALRDTVLEVELTPNRGDCLSVRGIAHEVAALFDRDLILPAPTPPAVADTGADALQVVVQTPLCSVYCGQVVTHGAARPSPHWLQMRLYACGMRSLGAVVDITNYVMFEWGQPLHAFDRAAVAGDHIVVREAQAQEVLYSLDGVRRDLQPGDVVIADERQAIGIAGIMGGANSEVQDSTRAVIVESAVFDPIATRRTALRLGLRTEAAQRFEKGVDAAASPLALARAVELLCAWAGAQVASAPVVWKREQVEQAAIIVRPERVRQVLGYELASERMLDFCRRLRLDCRWVDADRTALRVTVSSRRPDLLIEDDIVEEFARMAGYDEIPTTLPCGVLSVGALTARQQLRRQLRSRLVAEGFLEAWTYSLTSREALAALGDDNGQGGQTPFAAPLLLQNPLSAERECLRPTLLPSLLDAARHNTARGQTSVRLFELGYTFHPQDAAGGGLPLEREWLAIVLSGRADPPGPHASQRSVDVFDAKAAVETMLAMCGVLPAAQWVACERSYFRRGQAGQVLVNGSAVAEFGALRESVSQRWALPDTYYVELSVPQLADLAARQLHVHEVSRQPSAERDVALVLPRAVTSAAVLATAAAHARDLERVFIFDVYEGPGIPDDARSLAMRLVFRAEDRTLTDAEVASQVERVIAACAREYGATLRA